MRLGIASGESSCLAGTRAWVQVVVDTCAHPAWGRALVSPSKMSSIWVERIGKTFVAEETHLFSCTHWNLPEGCTRSSYRCEIRNLEWNKMFVSFVSLWPKYMTAMLREEASLMSRFLSVFSQAWQGGHSGSGHQRLFVCWEIRKQEGRVGSSRGLE